MSKVIGICNLHSEPSLGELTEKRPLGTVTFLGRYAIMDFLLSNFSNSGINIMPILVEKEVGLIRSHIRDGNIWINNTKVGFLRLLLNEKALSNPKLNTDVNNMAANAGILDSIECDYVIVASPHFIYSFDFNHLVNAIKHNGADMMIMYSTRNDAGTEFANCNALVLDGNRVVNWKKTSSASPNADVSLSTYIFKKSFLREMILNSQEISVFYTLKNLITTAIRANKYNIQGYKFSGYVVPILSLEGYVKKSFELLPYENRQKLFLEDWPIYTTTHNTPPAIYMEDAEVKNSFIANGSVIEGKVENSILSRDVKVGKGAEVKNSIIFTHTKIGEKAKLKYVVSDKSVVIENVKTLQGDKDDLIVIPQGAKV